MLLSSRGTEREVNFKKDEDQLSYPGQTNNDIRLPLLLVVVVLGWNLD